MDRLEFAGPATYCPEMDMPADKPFLVAALYRFAPVGAPARLRDELRALCGSLDLRGTLLVAAEGVNGTVAGSDEAIGRLVSFLRALPGFDGLDVKYSRAAVPPFHRMKARLKREIVTMGVAVDPGRRGAYVEPRDWNALIADPATIVIDTRNDYEVALGSFEGAIDPATESFSRFPDWARANRDVLAGRTVAMFCTGGIRCEKATAYVKSLGIDDVRHLRGGILKYLEEVAPQESMWQGECFVFDERVSVGHGLVQGASTLCRACRRPLTAADRARPEFAEGVACHHCRDERSDADRSRYAERQRQVTLAESRGRGRHIGR